MPETLAQRIRSKYPGVYDDLEDAALEKRVRAKYPGTYDDVPRTPQRVMAYDDMAPYAMEVEDPEGFYEDQAAAAYTGGAMGAGGMGAAVTAAHALAKGKGVVRAGGEAVSSLIGGKVAGKVAGTVLAPIAGKVLSPAAAKLAQFLMRGRSAQGAAGSVVPAVERIATEAVEASIPGGISSVGAGVAREAVEAAPNVVPFASKATEQLARAAQRSGRGVPDVPGPNMVENIANYVKKFESHQSVTSMANHIRLKIPGASRYSKEEIVALIEGALKQ